MAPEYLPNAVTPSPPPRTPSPTSEPMTGWQVGLRPPRTPRPPPKTPNPESGWQVGWQPRQPLFLRDLRNLIHARAATTITATARGRLARIEMQRRADALMKHRADAVTAIAAIARGRQSRKEQKRIANQMRRAGAAARTITATARGRLARIEMKHRADAVTAIAAKALANAHALEQERIASAARLLQQQAAAEANKQTVLGMLTMRELDRKKANAARSIARPAATATPAKAARPAARATPSASYAVADEREAQLLDVRNRSAQRGKDVLAAQRAQNEKARIRYEKRRWGPPIPQQPIPQQSGPVTPWTTPGLLDPKRQTEVVRRKQRLLMKIARNESNQKKAQDRSGTPRVHVPTSKSPAHKKLTKQNNRQRTANGVVGHTPAAGRPSHM